MEFIDMAIRLMFPVLIFMLLLWQILKIKKQLEKHIRDRERETNQIWQEKIIDLNIIINKYDSTHHFINKYGAHLVAMLDEYNNKNKARNTKRNKKVNK